MNNNPAPNGPFYQDELFLRLIEDYLADRLDEKNALQLETLLKNSPEKLDCFCDQILVEGILQSEFDRSRAENVWDSNQREFGVSNVQEKTIGSEWLLSPEERRLLAGMVQPFQLPDSPSETAVQESAVPTHKTEIRKRPVQDDNAKRFDQFSKFVFGSFFMLLVIVGSLWMMQSLKDSTTQHAWKYRPLVTVGAVVDPVFYDNADTIKPGQTLSADKIRLKSGIVELTTIDGVNLILEGPIDFQIISARKTFCQQGKISAMVPPAGKGFEISSPNLSVIDLGTEFLFEVLPDSSEVHTMKGKVEVFDLVSQRTPVPEGKGVRLVPGKDGLRNIDANRVRFTTQKRVWDAFAKFLETKEKTWNERSEQVLSLPGTLVHFDFKDSSRVVSNLARPGQINGVPRQIRFGKGRYGNRDAVGFFNESSRVDLSIPQTFRSLTLLATIKPTSLDQFVHCLFVSRSDEKGSLVWQLTKEGHLQLGIQTGSTRFVSAPCFHPRNLGAWYTIATVIDAQASEIRHYLDGREIGREKFEGMPEIRPGDITLGNGLWHAKTLSQRRMNGWIDSFYLFDRCLSEEEIELLSQ